MVLRIALGLGIAGVIWVGYIASAVAWAFIRNITAFGWVIILGTLLLLSLVLHY